MENYANTKKILEKYYEAVNQKGDWQSFISDDMTFTSSGKITHGKEGYVEATTRFLRVVTSIKINEFIVEGNKAGVTVEYSLQSPSGKTSSCEVAEILMVDNDKIYSSCIFFDTAAFHSFMDQK